MSFIYPQVLIFLSIPLIILAILIITNRSNININFSQKSIQKLLTLNKTMPQSSRNILIFISLLLMIIALSRPVLPKESIEVESNATPIIIMLDISKSMKAKDIYPNRLEVAKTKIDSILESNRNLLISIIVFAKESYVLSPMSNDIESIKFLLKNFYSNNLFSEGSNLYSALNSANKILEKYENKNIILLSDGGDKSDFSNELNFLQDKNIKLYSIGLATNKGAPIKDGDSYITDKNGDIVNLSLNNAIKELAINSKGAYINFSYNKNDIEQILSKIDGQNEKSTINVKIYRELFYYPLILSIILLLPIYYSLFKFRKNQNKD